MLHLQKKNTKGTKSCVMRMTPELFQNLNSALYWASPDLCSCLLTNKTQLTGFCREASSAGLQSPGLRSCSTAWRFGSKDPTPPQTEEEREVSSEGKCNRVWKRSMVRVRYRIYLHHWTLCRGWCHSWWSLDILPCCIWHLPVIKQ